MCDRLLLTEELAEENWLSKALTLLVNISKRIHDVVISSKHGRFSVRGGEGGQGEYLLPRQTAFPIDLRVTSYD